MDTEQITHLGVTAPLNLWRLLGYKKAAYPTKEPLEAVTPFTHHDKPATDALNELVIIGKNISKSTGEAAIACALVERRLRLEERNRNDVARKEAQAVKELANAIKGASEREMVSSILNSLSEKTRYAVLQQLKHRLS